MTSPGSFSEGTGDSPGEGLESTNLLPGKRRSGQYSVSNPAMTHYQSVDISEGAGSPIADDDSRTRSLSNVIASPQPNPLYESDERSVEIETSQTDQAMTEHTTSDLQCLMHILKGNIGTGVLAMPIAMKHAGIWTGFVGVLFIGFVATHCMHILVKSSRMLTKRMGYDKLSYAEVMEECLKTGPPALRRLAPLSKDIVNILLLFTQFGFCCVYIVFDAESIKDVVDDFVTNSVDVRVYEIGVALLLIPYCLIRDLRTLAPFSLFANCLTVVGMVLIFVNITQGLHDASDLPAFTNFSDLPMFFGTAIFAFEGISLVLPLESSMRERERFSGLAGVLNLSMVTVTCLYTGVGFFGYLKFGDLVKGSITLNLPSNPWYYLIVKPMFAISIFVSYNVQFYVPIRIIHPWVVRKLCIESARRKYLAESLLRVLFVLITMGCAMAIPHIDLLIALIGALASSSLALILPAFIHTLTLMGEEKRPNTLTITKNILITIFGIIGFATGTYTSIREIIQKF